MTPPLKPRKTQVTCTLDGRLHVAMGLGPIVRPVVLILVAEGSK